MGFLFDMKLSDLISQTNPYQLIPRHITSSYEVVKLLVDNYLVTREEIFINEFLKQQAVSYAKQIYNAQESDCEGIDLEFMKDGIEFLITIGTTPYPAQSIENENLINTLLIACQSKRKEIPDIPVRAVYGCFYGVDNQPDKGNYFILCGQQFWEFVSGDPDCYLKIIEPVSKLSFLRNDSCFDEYSRLLNKLEAEFLRDFCTDGLIDWPKLIKLNSGSSRI